MDERRVGEEPVNQAKQPIIGKHLVGERPVPRESLPSVAHFGGKLRRTEIMRRGLRRMTGLTQQLAQNDVGLPVLRMRLDDRACGGERLVELNPGPRGLSPGVSGGDCAWRGRHRGAKGGRRLDAKTAR
jgi:hypothetical protein